MLRNSGEAEEVVQQVFLDTYKAIDQFDPQKASYKTWLFQYAYHRAMNRRRHLKSNGFYSSVQLNERELIAELYESAGRLIQHLTPEETAQVIRQLLRSKTIHRKQRMAITLTFFHGYTAEEIAARTGETPAAVRHNLYRGLGKLREVLLESAKQKALEHKTKAERMLVVDPARLL
jgi:RNA polymerase sigma-70 factor (ECF subfamily)